MYLPKVIAYNAKDPTAKARYGVIADKMHLGGENDDEKVALLIQYLRGMNDKLNIPHCIGHYGPDSYPAEQALSPRTYSSRDCPRSQRTRLPMPAPAPTRASRPRRRWKSC